MIDDGADTQSFMAYRFPSRYGGEQAAVVAAATVAVATASPPAHGMLKLEICLPGLWATNVGSGQWAVHRQDSSPCC